MVRGLEDFLYKYEDLRLNLQHLCKKLGMAVSVSVTPALGGRDKGTPGAHWPASLTKMVRCQSVQ